MTNFYNFLLYHDVCPEYEKNIYAARKTVDIARDELKVIDRVEKGLCANDSFNAACVRLGSQSKSSQGFRNPYSRQAGEVPWRSQALTADISVWDCPGRELNQVFICACYAAFATLDDIERLNDKYHARAGNTRQDKSELLPKAEAATEELGLEIVSLHASAGEQLFVLKKAQEKLGTEKCVDGSQRPIIPMMAVMKCRRWEIPHKRPADLPKNWMSPFPDQIQLIINERILPYCRVGMKLQVELRKLNNGMFFIQHLLWLHPSFYVCLYNDVGRLRQMTIDGGDDEVSSKKDAQQVDDQSDKGSDFS